MALPSSIDAMHGHFLRKDVFGFIDKAISIASRQYPEEFLLHRDHIADKLFSSVSIASKNSDGSDSSRNIESGQSPDDHTKKRSIIVRLKIPGFFSSEECKNSGSTVKESTAGNEKIPARKGAESVNNVVRVKTKSAEPVPGSNTGINARKSVKNVAGINKGRLEPAPAGSKIGACAKKGRESVDNVPGCKKRNLEAVPDDRIEIARRQLKQSYQKCEEDKKRRRIQLIDLKDATRPPSDPKRTRKYSRR